MGVTCELGVKNCVLLLEYDVKSVFSLAVNVYFGWL
jgi:hypothetical protein